MHDIFLKIINGEIPSTKIYEDEHTYAFLDIKPNNKGHALVVPKAWSRNVLDIDETTFLHMARTAHKLARAIKEATGADGVNILMNNEPAAGQEVFHSHIHIIPRFSEDGVFSKSKHTAYDDGEMDQVAAHIRSLLT